jgi:serine protease Do
MSRFTPSTTTVLAVLGLATTILVARGILAAESPPPAQPSQAVLEAESQRIAVMAKAKQSVLAVFGPGGGGGGSGVVISPDGFALSNFHVARPCGNAMKCGMADGKVYDAVVVGLDPVGDVALIKVLGRDDFPHAELGDSDRLSPGDWVFAMGNPFLLANDFQPTATYGIVSGTHRYQEPAGTLLEYTDCIQTDASINPGNSGGPLFDSQGRLVGINGRGSFEKRGRVSVGVGYAISINQIKNFLGCLHSGRILDHATLGARVGHDEAGRVLVTDILESSDAFRRGLRYDDEVLAFAGRPIATPNAFKNTLGIYPKGWRVPLSYRREGKRYDVQVRLAGVYSKEDLLQKALGRPPELPGPKPEPKPKDGGKPQPKPLPKPMHMAMPQTPMPEVVKKHFEEKRGYANYYFNKLEQDRVWKAWLGRANLPGRGRIWTISGTLESGGAFSFQLSDAGASLKAPVGETKWTAGKALNAALDPPGSGGLLPALYLWRRLALEGLQDFGEVYYLGTSPLAGQAGLVDVLVGSHAGVECRFYFDPAKGDLLALEMFPSDDADPCEVYFSGYHNVDGRSLPAQMEVRVGEDRFGLFKLGEFKFEKVEEKK